ncbi:MAG TPA: FAD-binding oxidoreductase [Candidatus Limnocylindria bacterium]|nr:FAD-binding oxidoreductase [Candidatus Limnocylindria bacterium]
MQTTTTPQLDIDLLRTDVRGSVITPDDPTYDETRTVMPGDVDGHPAAIVRVADADDVAAVIAFARDSGAELAVRCGGHSGAGHSTTEGGVVIDLRDLKAIEIDPEARTAWAEGGATAAEVTIAAAEHDLAIGFGDTGSVGIGGLTLGGGVGYLVRKHGLTIDNLLAAEIVTASGERVLVDAEQHPDLFWAIRGGGGNFGVVTRFKYRLHPLGEMVGGILILPATVETIAGYVAASEAAPEELSGIGNVMPCPPMPFVPEEHHGKLVVMAILAYAGPVDEGQAAMAPFRELATPLADMVRPIRYPEMYPPAEEEYRPLAVARTMFIDHVDGAVAETILEHLEASDAPMRACQLRVLGGAMARVPADATAFAHRSSKIMVNIAAFYEGPQDRAAKEAWVEGFVAAIQQGDKGAYVNFLVDEGQERVHAAYPGKTYERLAAVKATYDPDDLFRRNQNILPATS